MQWNSSDRRSSNIEDGRGGGLGRGAAVGGGSVVVALVLALLGAPKEMVNSVLSGGGRQAGPVEAPPLTPAQEKSVEMLGVILADTEDVWGQLLQGQYKAPRLRFFSEGTESGCGFASSAVGPFYCPADQKVYLDLTFFDELDRRFGAPGDFAQAYVVAHEVGHHVQTLTGISEKVHARRARSSEADSNALSVRQELQADCYAGVWAHHAAKTKNRLVAGDLEEGLAAAAAIGDDTLQKKARGHVAPESFTHGSSAQRVSWFKRGFEGGNPQNCNSFASEQL